MLKILPKTISFYFVLWLMFLVAGCYNSNSLGNQFNTIKAQPSPASTLSAEVGRTSVTIDVPKLADKSPADFEQIFGKAIEIKAVKDNNNQLLGEYRLYQTPNHPQGLSVHFYDNKAVVFNLVLGKAQKSPRTSLLDYFEIDLKDAAPIEKTQFLEKWRGRFNNVDFVSVYAMKERIENADYKLLHAEVKR